MPMPATRTIKTVDITKVIKAIKTTITMTNIMTRGMVANSITDRVNGPDVVGTTLKKTRNPSATSQ